MEHIMEITMFSLEYLYDPWKQRQNNGMFHMFYYVIIEIYLLLYTQH